MKHFPIFLALEGRRVILSGGGDAALAKLRLLLKTEAHIAVFAAHADSQIKSWASDGRLELIERSMETGDAHGASLFYAADEDKREDARTSAIARTDGVLTNIVDNLQDSQFITPAIVDRDPVTIAIGTEGAAPVLARAIKADLEARLPATLGPLARAAKAFRHFADVLPMGRARRTFWTSFFFQSGPTALDLDPDADLHRTLKTEVKNHLSAKAQSGSVTFAVVASGDPELLLLKTRNTLHEADLVLHETGISTPILDLARREATFGPLPTANDTLINTARKGDNVMCLMANAPSQHMIMACRAAGIATHVIPGIAPLTVLTEMKETA